MNYRIEHFAISDIGLHRKMNQDAWASNPKHHFFVLADGLGGHNAGEIASKETVQTLCRKIDNLFSLFPKSSLRASETLSYLKEGICSTNSWIFCLSNENTNLQGMATTLCCLLFHEDKVLYANVGDSRIYRFRTRLERLSSDHRVSPPVKNMLTRAIGRSRYVIPHLSSSPITPHDIYFLCSDGLTDYVKEEEIEKILNQGEGIQESSAKLVHIAKMHGGNDNITVLMAKIHPCQEFT